MADEEDEDGQAHIFISTPSSGAVLKDGMAQCGVGCRKGTTAMLAYSRVGSELAASLREFSFDELLSQDRHYQLLLLRSRSQMA